MATLEESNKAIVLAGFERGFGQGDLSVFDETLDGGHGRDHQDNCAGPDFVAHIKAVVSEMRAAYPDLRFEVHSILAEGDTVATRSTMTGTHRGTWRGTPPTGRPVAVPHMHFFRLENGRVTDLWHVMNVPLWAQQIGAGGPRQAAPA